MFSFENNTQSIPNTFGNTVWLKVVRNWHDLTAFVSGDGKKWISVGSSISLKNLDKVQPQYNSWVGTSVGLFTENQQADFDFFIGKDGSTEIPAVSYSNYYGVEKTELASEKVIKPISNKGGWLMIAGLDLRNAKKVSLNISSNTKGNIEIWQDDLKSGILLAKMPFNATSTNSFRDFTMKINTTTGQHDVFIKFPTNSTEVYLKSIQFHPKSFRIILNLFKES